MTESLGNIFLSLKDNTLYLADHVNNADPPITFHRGTFLLREDTNEFYMFDTAYRLIRSAKQNELVKEFRSILNDPFSTAYKKSFNVFTIQYAYLPVIYDTIIVDGIRFTIIAKEFFLIIGNNKDHDIIRLVDDSGKSQTIVENLSLEEAAKEFNNFIAKESEKTAHAICHLFLLNIKDEEATND